MLRQKKLVIDPKSEFRVMQNNTCKYDTSAVSFFLFILVLEE